MAVGVRGASWRRVARGDTIELELTKVEAWRVSPRVCTVGDAAHGGAKWMLAAVLRPLPRLPRAAAAAAAVAWLSGLCCHNISRLTGGNFELNEFLCLSS